MSRDGHDHAGITSRHANVTSRHADTLFLLYLYRIKPCFKHLNNFFKLLEAPLLCQTLKIYLN